MMNFNIPINQPNFSRINYLAICLGKSNEELLNAIVGDVLDKVIKASTPGGELGVDLTPIEGALERLMRVTRASDGAQS